MVTALHRSKVTHGDMEFPSGKELKDATIQPTEVFVRFHIFMSYTFTQHLHHDVQVPSVFYFTMA